MQAQLFCALARFYGFDFNQIAEMTPAQTDLLIQGAVNQGKVEPDRSYNTDGTITFTTLDSLQLWRETR